MCDCRNHKARLFFEEKRAVVSVYCLDISQLEENVYDFVIVCRIHAAGLKGSLDRALMGPTDGIGPT